jgi:hypothetical protein
VYHPFSPNRERVNNPIRERVNPIGTNRTPEHAKAGNHTRTSFLIPLITPFFHGSGVAFAVYFRRSPPAAPPDPPERLLVTLLPTTASTTKFNQDEIIN